MFNSTAENNLQKAPPMRLFFELPLQKAYPIRKEMNTVLMESKHSHAYHGATGQDFVDSYNVFIQAVNVDLLALNEHIKVYNQLSNAAEKLNKLQDIADKHQHMLSQYSDGLIRHCPSFQSKIQEGLVTEIQTQAKALGVPSVHYLRTPRVTAPQSPALVLFSELFMDMHPNIASKLLAMLLDKSKFNRADFTRLYPANNTDYNKFQKFLTNLDSIAYYKGENSYLYKITLVDNSPPFHIKVDNRLGNPYVVEDRLRSQPELQGIFTQIYAKRQVTAVVDGERVTRTLQLTECISGSDLGEEVDRLDVHARLLSAPAIFINIVQSFITLHALGASHPDPKLSNFLLENGILRWGDTKALAPVEQDKCFDKKALKKAGYTLISSYHIRPPEYSALHYAADSAIAHIIGKNLYRYITGCSSRYLEGKQDSGVYDFSNAMFNTPNGQVFQYLIKAAVKANPHERIRLEDIIVILQDMSLTRAHCWEMLDALRKLGADSHVIQRLDAETRRVTTDGLQGIAARLTQFLQEQQVAQPLKRQVCEAWLRHTYDASDAQFFAYMYCIQHADLGELETLTLRFETKKKEVDARRADCHKHLTNIATATYGQSDRLMLRFQKKYYFLVENAKANQIDAIATKLRTVGDDIVPAKEAVEEVIAGIQKSFTLFKDSKVGTLRSIIRQLPVKCRGKHIMAADVPDNVEVLQRAVATHPFFADNAVYNNTKPQKFTMHV